MAPALSRLEEERPGLQVRLEVFDRLVDEAGEGFDLDVRVGDEIAPHLIARRLADNHRVLCAAPAYLKRKGAPRSVADLAAHDCLVIKERDHPFGVWRLRSGAQEESVKVRRPLSANKGEMAVKWAVYPTRLERSAKVRVCVEFLQVHFRAGWAVRGAEAGAGANSPG